MPIGKNLCMALAAAILLLVAAVSAQSTVVYVDDNGAGAEDGTSWADAYIYLQDALSEANDAQKPVVIRVAGGLYKPDQGQGITPGDQRASFQLIDGVAIVGGFAGHAAADPDQRNILLYETVLSGDLAGDDEPVNEIAALRDEPTRSENSRHVVLGSDTDDTAVLEGFTITAGNATGSAKGGGMYNVAGSPTVMDCRFIANAAKDGGGVFNKDGAEPLFLRCTFVGNYARGMVSEDSAPTLHACSIEANHAGGLFNEDSAPTLYACSIRTNRRGGMINKDSSVRLSDCLFENSRGRALQNSFSTVLIEDCNFIGNHDGAISNTGSTCTSVRCVFIDNRGNSGGAITSISHGTEVLESCDFIGNSASIGGAFNMHWGDATFKDCSFSRNKAMMLGGAVYLYAVEQPRLTNCLFLGNSVYGQGQQGGGGLWLGQSDATVANCAFVGNSGYFRAAGMNIIESDPTLINCIFVANYMLASNSNAFGGGGILCHNSDTTVANCIFWANRADRGEQITAMSGTHVTITNSIVQRGKADMYIQVGGSVDWGIGNSTADPIFVRAPDDGGDGWIDDSDTPEVDESANDDPGDLRLRSGSPAIDAGDNTAVPPDVDDLDGDANRSEPLPCDLGGNPRFLDGPTTGGGRAGTAPLVDMGAYEYGLPQLATGDFDSDGDVDLADFGILANHWRHVIWNPCIGADVTGDTRVDYSDVASVCLHWLQDGPE